MANNFYYLLVFLCLPIIGISSASKCVQKNHCSCSIDDYSFISLTNLQPPDPAKKFFQDGQVYISYFFSGCQDKDFNPKEFDLIFNQTLQGVSLVKCNSTISNIDPNSNNSVHLNYSVITQTCKSIGSATHLKFDLVQSTTDQYQIIYVNKTSNNSLPSVRLVCDTYNTTSLKILSSDTDALALYSPLACIQHISHHDLSSGSIFCIIFFITAIIYFIGGGLVMYFARGARGVEVIPNFDFWVSIPGLIRDGLIYILSGCRPSTVNTAETYDRI